MNWDMKWDGAVRFITRTRQGFQMSDKVGEHTLNTATLYRRKFVRNKDSGVKGRIAVGPIQSDSLSLMTMEGFFSEA